MSPPRLTLLFCVGVEVEQCLPVLERIGLGLDGPVRKLPLGPEDSLDFVRVDNPADIGVGDLGVREAKGVDSQQCEGSLSV